ncbi:MAG: glycosyltransferase [Phycisphaerales bacterium]|nr:glycosyltransferase [Phycisphaerales bacterium]
MTKQIDSNTTDSSSKNTCSTTTTVIICTRDRPDDLRGCLQSLEEQSVLPDRVVIVAGSEVSCPSNIVDCFHSLDIVVVDSHENNISISRNVGLKATTTEFALFIDDDAKAHDDWVESYLKVFADQPLAWAIGGKVLDSRSIPYSIEFAYGLVSTTGMQIPVRSDEQAPRPRGYFNTVKGCNFGVRCQQIHQLGGFDSFFAFAYDEADLMLTIEHAGGLVMHAQSPVVDHAHTPGHYRQAHPLDCDWRVEYASHTMFMLKHTHRFQRIYGELVIVRRFCKLVCDASIAALRRQISPSRCGGILRDARIGIGEARVVYSERDSRV